MSGKDAKLDTGVARSGRRSLRLSNQSLEDSSRASQVLRFDPPVKHPFRISGWSRAQDVEVVQDYDIFLDLEYADGTPLWGQVARFTPGTHDWQQAELVFDVAKPVREIKVFVFLRKGKGTVWFDDLEVGLAPFAYRVLRVMPNVFGTGTLGVFGTATMPARWRATLEGPGGQVGQTDGQEMPIRFDWINPSTPRRRLHPPPERDGWTPRPNDRTPPGRGPEAHHRAKPGLCRLDRNEHASGLAL